MLVPTRDLVVQVYDVLKILTKDTKLGVAMLYGDKSFRAEQDMLVQSYAYVL